MPEFCVQTALQLVAFYVFDFTDETSVCRTYSCLSFLFNSLLGRRNGFGFLATEFYFKLFGLMRCGRNVIAPEDEEFNKVSLASYHPQISFALIYDMIYIYICFSLSILKKHSGFADCPKNSYGIMVF